MSKRSQLLASIPRVEALLEAATAEASQDLDLIKLCRECLWIETGSALVYSATVDASSENQSFNEEMDRPLAQRAIELLERINGMRPTTKEGREVVAHVALGFAIRAADDAIETGSVAEAVAWGLVERLVEVPA